jgi:hypothetical protein
MAAEVAGMNLAYLRKKSVVVECGNDCAGV